jgi:hypothetical protein
MMLAFSTKQVYIAAASIKTFDTRDLDIHIWRVTLGTYMAD